MLLLVGQCGHLHRQDDIVDDGQMTNEVKALEHEPNRLPAVLVQ